MQGVIERALQNPMYGAGNPLFSTTDERAIFNPATAAQEFAGGAVVGGVLGGGQIGAARGINACLLYTSGKRIARKGWNGKGQYVELAKAISYKSPTGAVVNAEHDAIGNQALAFVGTSGVQMGWLASQADMLADDWELVEG